MRKLSKILIIYFVCMIFSGCHSINETASAETTIDPVEYVHVPFPLSFTVPEGYAFREGYNCVFFTQDDQVVGGIVLTDLHEDCVQYAQCSHVEQYLKRYATEPLDMGYIIQYYGKEAYVSLSIEDPETGNVRYESHRLFLKMGDYYDFWADSSAFTEEEQKSLFESIKAIEDPTEEMTTP